MTGAEELVSITSRFELGKTYTCQEIIHAYRTGGGTKSDPIPSDYCYNCTNNGINFDDRSHRIFEKIGSGKYRYWGSNYEFSGIVTHTKKSGKTSVYGKWTRGRFIPE
jgi:hypothetical protein